MLLAISTEVRQQRLVIITEAYSCCLGQKKKCLRVKACGKMARDFTYVALQLAQDSLGEE